MKKTLSRAMLALIITLLLLCSLSAFGQKKRDAAAPRPVQIQLLDSTPVLVQYIPLADAIRGVDAQAAQVAKQLEQVDKQIAELVKKRDGFLQQKAELEYYAAQLKTPLPTAKTPEAKPAPPDPEKPAAAKPKKPRKKKN